MACTRKRMSGFGLLTTVFLLLFLKFIFFDVLWCLDTTFTPFSHPELWLSSLTASLLILSPLACRRLWKTEIVLFILIDILLIANLCYFNTYFNAIPLGSYLLAGNLSDFTDSVWSSLKVSYVVFPLLTIVSGYILTRYHKNLPEFRMDTCLFYFDITALLFAALMLLQVKSGGFVRRVDEMRKDAYQYCSIVPSFTVFGHLIYELNTINPRLTPEDALEISTFIDNSPSLKSVVSEDDSRPNIVFILVESLESWVLETSVEGQEITPNLNRVLTENTTLYVPNVLTQVRAGRSIDGQLIYFTGLLPMLNGVYSTEHPDNTFFSLQKAMKQKHGTSNYLVTGDKIKTWNQEGVAKALGIDHTFSRPDFRMEESSGKHKRIGDRALMRQLIEKIKEGRIWKPGENVFLQIVTFTSHHPFRIDDSLKGIRFSSEVPQLMNDYMTAVHYTDEALGILLDYLQKRPDYDDTMIVIAGDHEGLASGREGLVHSAKGNGVVSPWQFTPFIVLNSPISGKYTPVVGQIDIYPTLLSLLGLTDYPWHGLGRSIFDFDRQPVAVGSRMNLLTGTPSYRKTPVVTGDSTWFSMDITDGKLPVLKTDPADPEYIRAVQRARQAHQVSDKILSFDYFSR